ncbi:5-hydroxytryptamine receptor 3A isoform 2-T2 [Menidia menidia]
MHHNYSIQSSCCCCSYDGLLAHLGLQEPDPVLRNRRPVKNWTRPTNVQLDMLLYGILDVDEKFQTVTSHIWIETHWPNEFLTWNSSHFCGIDLLTFPRSAFWVPDVCIEEDASDSGSIQIDPVVSLRASGLVSLTARQRLTYTCQLDLAMFPFDTQRCNITFSSMSSNARSIVLGTVKNDTTLTRISENHMITQGEWKLNSVAAVQRMSSISHSPASKLIYMITMERKPMLYVINLIVPLFYLLVLDLGSFFICEAGGEKLGFKVTVLLAISVLLLILKDILPSTEDDLPMIAKYCISVFTMVWLSVLEAMLVSFLIQLDDSGGKKKAHSSSEGIQLEEKPNKESPGVEAKGPLDPPSDLHLLRLVLEEVKAAKRQDNGQEKDQRKPGCYRTLAKAIDRVFFVCYFLTVLIFIVFMFIWWIHT